MGVVNLPSGQPTMKLTGGAAKRLAAITPKGTEAQIALTITDEYPVAQAVVIISAVTKASQKMGNFRCGYGFNVAALTQAAQLGFLAGLI